MAGFKGKNFLLALGSSATVPVYTAIAGQKSTSYSGSNSPIDVTSKDSNFARTLLDLAGVYDAQVTISGVYADDAGILTINQLQTSGALRLWQIINDNGDKWQFSGKVTQVQLSGAHDGAEEYSVTIQSSGVITQVLST